MLFIGEVVKFCTQPFLAVNTRVTIVQYSVYAMAVVQRIRWAVIGECAFFRKFSVVFLFYDVIGFYALSSLQKKFLSPFFA